MILWGGSTNGPHGGAGQVHGASHGRRQDGRRSRSSSSAIRCTKRPTPISRRSPRWRIQIRDKVSEANNAVDSDSRRQAAGRRSTRPSRRTRKLKTAGDKLTKNLSDVEEEIYQVKNQSGQDPLNFPIKINNRLASLLGVVSRADARPIAQCLSDLHRPQGRAQGADGSSSEGADHGPGGVQWRREATRPRDCDRRKTGRVLTSVCPDMESFAD